MNAAALFVQPTNMLANGGTKEFGAEIASLQMATSTGGSFGAAQPNLSAIMSHLQYEYENYKFTVYRGASKFVTLQKIFFTSNIPYKLVLAVLTRHGICDEESNLMVPPFQLAKLIHDIYFACEKLGHFTKVSGYKLESATALLANFFWNIFDPNRRHSISLLEIKVTFLLLCKLYASDQLVSEFFSLVCDAKSKCVSKLKFEYLLIILTKMLTYIGEGNAYGGHNSQLVMEQCFARSQNVGGLTEYQFHCIWTTTQTRFLIYANLIALIKRIEDTEKLIHNNICASCRSPTIVGIRFKCQICKDLSLCLKCFSKGYASNKHEITHRIFEVFTEDAPPKKFTHYFAKLCNVFFASQSNNEEEKGFCNANETSNHNDTELVTIVTNRSSNASTVSADAASSVATVALVKQKIEDATKAKELNKFGQPHTGLSKATNASERLQSIIDRLQLQNAKLENQLKSVKTSTNDEIAQFLNTHQQFLIGIINEMRDFSQSTRSLNSYPTSSTPNRSVFAKNTTLDGFNAPGSCLTHSINGADINRSYLEANKSDYSINDLSTWFNQRRMSMPAGRLAPPLGVLTEVTNDGGADLVADMRETEMTNFKLLLHKVKEIVEDSYSDNTELAEATQNLEDVLDNIIKTEEESRRKST